MIVGSAENLQESEEAETTRPIPTVPDERISPIKNMPKLGEKQGRSAKWIDKERGPLPGRPQREMK